MFKFLFIILSLSFINIYSVEFLNGKLENKTYTLENYYNDLGIGDISLRINKCDKKKKNCETDILAVSFEENKRVVKKIYNFDFGYVSIVAKGRYSDHNSAILKQVVEFVDPKTKDKKLIDRFWLISNQSGKYLKTETLNPKSKIIKKDDTPLILENFGLKKFEISEIAYATDLSGKISVVILDKKNTLNVSNGERWISIKDYTLENHVKKDDILSIYPDSNSNKVYIAIYKYINPFNKGLDLIVVDFDKNDSFYTTIYSSDEFNLGSSPNIYSTKDNLFITAIDLDNNTQKTIINNINNLEKIKYSKSPYVKGFENEIKYFFMLAPSLIKDFWYIKAKVADYANTKYYLESNFSYSGYFQAGSKDIKLGVLYSQSKMEGKDSLDGGFSQLLTMNLNFNSFFHKKLSLKIFTQYSKLKGVATSNYGKNEISSNTEETFTESFDMVSWRGDLLFIWNDKLYTGISYLNYNMPSVIGLKDNNVNIVYTAYDKDLSSNNIEFLIGYNIPSYVNYDEVNYNKFYMGGNIGFGFGFLDLSSKFLSKMKLSIGDKTIINKYTINFSGILEIGFIFQRRFRNLSGMGYSLVAGFRVKGSLLTSSLNDEDKITNLQSTEINGTDLSLEHQRLYINYGPFVIFSWIF